MLRFERPDRPAGFVAAVREARRTVGGLAAKPGALNAEAFPDVWRKFKAVFREVQHGKCGYCEGDMATVGHGDMEHYRPKSSVSRIVSGVVRPWRSEACASLETASEMGYWWLAYVWWNYLYACQICNQTWKRDLFPLEGGNPVQLKRGCHKSERPLLLNPFGKIPPEDHLRFDEAGRIFAKDDSPRGEATIETCGLHRERLVTARHEIAVRVVTLIYEITARATQGRVNESIRELQEKGTRSKPFAGMVRALVAEKIGVTVVRTLWPDHL